MATTKKMAAFVAAFVMGLVNFVLTSCQADSESVRTEYAAPKTIETPVLVYQDKLVNIVSNVYFDGKTIVVGDKVAATVDVNHTMPVIEMPADKHAAATITSSSDLEWRDSNGQLTKGTLNIVAGDNYEIFGTLYPAANYSTITKVHPKVSVVNTHHTFEGSVNVTVENDTKSKSFNFDLARQYFLVDPTVDVEIVNTHTTDTLIQVVVKTDTLVNTVIVEKHDTTVVEKVVEKTVTLTDTIKVEVERFVKGADVVKSVVNDFGFSKATMTLGSKQLLAVEIRHQYPILDVEESILGSANFTEVAALNWDGSDGQKTNATVNAQGCTVDGVSYVRSEANTLVAGSLVQIRTIYRVYGTYKNENGDVNNFEMEMAPSYLQKYEATPQPQIEDKPMYRGIIRKVTAEGLKLMTKPVVQKWNGTAWEDVRTCSRSCIGMSGSPSGLDLFVKSSKIIEETENSWNYSGNDATWAGDDTKSDGTIITKRTKVYEFNHMFTADAVNNGKVGPATQLYVMKAERVQVLDPDNNLLTCTWEDGSDFSLNVSVVLNSTEFVEKSEMVGQTRTESDKTYKYLTSFVQHFTATVGGQKLQDVDAVSTLWVPAE
jgi:hypothetical protein